MADKKNPLKFFNDEYDNRVRKFQNERFDNTSGNVPPPTNRQMLEMINNNPGQYRRDRNPDVAKIYTDLNIPLTGSMSRADSLQMAEIESSLFNDTSGTQAKKLAKGCGNGKNSNCSPAPKRKGGVIKYKKK